MSASNGIHRILFLRTDRLGETLLTLPATAALKAAHPHATLTLLVQPALEPLVRRVPWIDQVMSYDSHAMPGWWQRAFRLGQQLRARHFDVAIVSNPMKELHAAVWLASIPCRVGYHRKWGGLLTQRLADTKALGERHEAEYNLDLVRALGVPTTIPSWSLPQFEDEQRDVLQMLLPYGIRASGRLIAVHPWTSNPLKQWPVDRFEEVTRRLAASGGVNVVIVGGPDERAQADAILSRRWPAVNLVGRLSLTQLAALLQRAQLLISNDSGPVHVAAAVQTKTVTLFGTTNPAAGPRRWGPRGRGHVVIWKASMEAIAVEDVWDAVQQQLG